MKFSEAYLRKVMRSDLEAFKQMKRRQIKLNLEKFEEQERLRQAALASEALPQSLTVEGENK